MLTKCNERLCRLKAGLGLEVEPPPIPERQESSAERVRVLSYARNPCAFGEKCSRIHEAKHRLAFAHPEQPDEAEWALKAEMEDPPPPLYIK